MSVYWNMAHCSVEIFSSTTVCLILIGRNRYDTVENSVLFKAHLPYLLCMATLCSLYVKSISLISVLQGRQVCTLLGLLWISCVLYIATSSQLPASWISFITIQLKHCNVCVCVCVHIFNNFALKKKKTFRIFHCCWWRAISHYL